VYLWIFAGVLEENLMKQSSVQFKTTLWVRLAAVSVILAIAACSPAGQQTSSLATPITVTEAPTQAASTPDLYVGDLVNPPVQLQDFTMPSSTGEDMSLSDLDGQWRMIFFGYLHCPDFCPLTLAEYRQVKALLGEDAEQIKFLYISVDGLRDTPESMRAYLNNFDPEFIGFSGDDETLESIQSDYGFYYRRQMNTSSQAIYIVDHSTRSYLVNPSGQLVASFTYDAEPRAIASAIQWHMQQTGI